jgi:hypothetical protein
MAHGHLHPGESMRDYFTEQLLTILVCGLFGFAAIQMYRNNMLGFLAPNFHEPVLYGGIGVLILVAFRAFTVWKEAGELQSQAMEMGCGVNHVQGTDCCGPDIAGPDGEPDHTHSHDMSWLFARMMILVFPVALFFMGLPSATLSAEEQLRRAGTDTALNAKSLQELAQAEGTKTKDEKVEADGTVVRTLVTKTGGLIRMTIPKSGEPSYALITGDAVHMKFNELNEAAFSEASRESKAGQTVIVTGHFKRLADKEFTVYRMKMACCVADAITLKVRIVVPQALSNKKDGEWVEAKGQLQFYKIPAQGNSPAQYVPVIVVADITDVKPLPEQFEYEF